MHAAFIIIYNGLIDKYVGNELEVFCSCRFINQCFSPNVKVVKLVCMFVLECDFPRAYLHACACVCVCVLPEGDACLVVCVGVVTQKFIQSPPSSCFITSSLLVSVVKKTSAVVSCCAELKPQIVLEQGSRMLMCSPHSSFRGETACCCGRTLQVTLHPCGFWLTEV